MISVIVPFYNSKKTLKDCIASILSQKTSEGFELLLVDDGSTDSSREIIRGFSDKRVRLLHQENSGPAKARNLGVKNAKGSIVLFVDSDCVAAASWLEEMIKPILQGKASGVQGVYKTRQKELMARFVQLEIEDRYDLMLKSKSIDFIGTYSAAYDRASFIKAMGFDESFTMASGEDTELSYNLSGKGYRLVVNPKAVVFHSHPTSLQKYLKLKFYRAVWRCRLYRKHSGKMLKDSYTPQVLKLQILLFYGIILGLLWGIFYSQGVFFALLCLGFLFVSMLPFTVKVGLKDSAVGLFAPLVLFLRSAVFAVGLAMGALKGVAGK